MSGLRASEPLGGGLRASGGLGETAGLALVVLAVVLAVLVWLVVAYIVVWLIVRLLVWAVRLCVARWAAPRAKKLE